MTSIVEIFLHILHSENDQNDSNYFNSKRIEQRKDILQIVYSITV